MPFPHGVDSGCAGFIAIPCAPCRLEDPNSAFSNKDKTTPPLTQLAAVTAFLFKSYCYDRIIALPNPTSVCKERSLHGRPLRKRASGLESGGSEVCDCKPARFFAGTQCCRRTPLGGNRKRMLWCLGERTDKARLLGQSP
jgi:hypothetical protein